ncbi:hypothetical protein N9153_03270 [Planctomicrobium sp.]|jgi:hypothetical protein|nr:hypothetical protein [Planctomicrobium sp.]
MNENLERDRQVLLAGLLEDDSHENFEVGSFGHHEALDRAHIQLDNWSQHLAEHPFVILHPDLFEKANVITGLMADFYQSVGALE